MLQLRPAGGLVLLAATVLTAVVLPAGVLAFGSDGPSETREWRLDRVGGWEGVMRISRPGMPAMEFEITETISAVGGLWTTGDLVGEFLGQAYAAHVVMGFDDVKKALVGTRCDSRVAHLALMKGRYDAEAKVAHMAWTAPASGRDGPVPHRSEERLRGDTLEVKFFEGDGRDEILTVTVEAKRKVD